MSGESRYHKENLTSIHIPFITAYQDDVSRVIHSNFFRRLQGKSQLFPAGESDFFRNRLTHSLEVANIAKAIAANINQEHGANVPLDVVEVAGLCHDAGHPPFGHKGERALFKLMKDFGGFEGNAQTLHLVSRVEKLIKKTESAHYGIGGKKGDMRKGLNLTARSLASLLKYDKEIPRSIQQERKALIKGYYSYEADLVQWIKREITGVDNFSGEFKTVECQIMDIADDIAYSTFDLVDALHAGFIRMSDLLGGGIGSQTLSTVAKEVEESLQSQGKIGADYEITDKDVLETLSNLIVGPLGYEGDNGEFTVDLSRAGGFAALRVFLRKLERFARNGYQRSFLARYLVARFINSINFEKNERCPALSKVWLDENAALEIECLKKFVYVTTTKQSRVQVSEYRATYVIETIYNAINENAAALLPDDYVYMFLRLKNKEVQQQRVICDFIAGMTDRYALEFYGRLRSQDPETIFKPI